MPRHAPAAVAAVLATLGALLGALAHAWAARASTADASPAWSAISPAPAERASSSVPAARRPEPEGIWAVGIGAGMGRSHATVRYPAFRNRSGTTRNVVQVGCCRRNGHGEVVVGEGQTRGQLVLHFLASKGM